MPQPPEPAFSQPFTDDTLHAVSEALPFGPDDTDEMKLRRNEAAAHLLGSLDARQPVEAALASQAVLFHYASLAALHRSTRMPPLTTTSAGAEAANAARASMLFCRLLRELAWKQQTTPDPMPRRRQPTWPR